MNPLPPTLEVCVRPFNDSTCGGLIYRPQPGLIICPRCGGKEPGVIYGLASPSPSPPITSGAVGLDVERNANNGGARPICSACGSKTPLAGVQWLKQSPITTPKRSKVDVDAIWNACGNHCTHCGASRDLLRRLGIGLNAQHMVPFWKAGDAHPLVPYCARCHQESTARQATTRRIEDRETELDEIIRRIEKNHPELLSEDPS